MTTAAQAPPTAVKPKARGWIHFYSALVASAMSVALIACTIYSLTIIGLFTVSATYHRHDWTTVRARTWMKRADHSMIFVFIAGTYTPFSVLLLPQPTRTVVLTVVWAGALGGVALKMFWPTAPRWVGVPFYLAVGWVAIFVLPDLLRAGGVAVLVLMIAGGVLYSVGAVFYATRRPRGWPATFGYHEFFHACVSLAAICHCVAIWLSLFAG
jgi:hemolysin III